MLTKRNVHVPSLVVLAIGYLAGLIMFPHLPGPFLEEKVSARILVAFTLPTTAFVIYAVFRSLWAHDRVRSGNGAFESTYYGIVFRVLFFVVALQVIVMIELTQVLGLPLPAKRIVVVLFGLALIAIGNLLPRTRPNVAVGVRTRRTLASPPLWQKVHRFGGYATVSLGAVIAASGLVLTRDTIGGVIGISGILAAMSVVAAYWRASRAPEHQT
jgi:uncharacterized membrane protein